MNTHYDDYLLADSNLDLIKLFLFVKNEGEHFIQYCEKMFRSSLNHPEKYYKLRNNLIIMIILEGEPHFFSI